MNIHKAVIPAAGFGTRFLPATKALPKEMIPVVDKPIIQYGVEEAVMSGIQNIVVITSRGKIAMEDHFDSSPELESFLEEKGKINQLEDVRVISRLAEFCFIRQKKALGLGHAIGIAENYIGQEPFAALLPDDIFVCDIPCTKQLMDVYEEFKATIVVLGRVDEEGTKKYGIIKPKQISERVFQVEDLIEKPGPQKAQSDLGLIGRYVFSPGIFEAIRQTPPDHRGEIQITDAIRVLLDTQPVYGYLFEGTRYDCGHKLGLLQAAVALALKRPEFEQNLREFLKNLL
jgi:UTP--glucose-1-phosphate uridylyltransferase